MGGSLGQGQSSGYSSEFCSLAEEGMGFGDTEIKVGRLELEMELVAARKDDADTTQEMVTVVSIESGEEMGLYGYENYDDLRVFVHGTKLVEDRGRCPSEARGTFHSKQHEVRPKFSYLLRSSRYITEDVLEEQGCDGSAKPG